MNYRSLESIVPVTVYDENMKEIIRYKSIAKAALYLKISPKVVIRLVNSIHTKPYWSVTLDEFVYLRKTQDNDKTTKTR